ncbi:MAG: 4Fe-4S cluster-binding domain-containing protein [Muribaculaceae bacterium]|nr:4Fe-4S cluster-binding domain-containing protein [Muribaculaceae bacterium]
MVKKSINIPIVTPSTVGLITTTQCTAACKDCCFGCNQRNHEAMDYNMIINTLDKVVKSFPDIKLIVLTGGECFLLGEDILANIIRHINKLGLKSRIVTNGFWASSFKKAYKTILNLRECGLTEINVSTGDEHLKWVSLDNIINIIVAAVKNKIPISINIESSVSKFFMSRDLLEDYRIQKFIDSGLIYIVNGHWVSASKTDDSITKRDSKHISSGNTLRCTSIFSSPSILPNGSIIACCGLTSQDHESLILGNVLTSDLSCIFEKSIYDFIKLWIYTDGPYSLLEYCNKVDPHLPNIDKGLHICEYCKFLYTNDDYFSTLKKYYRYKIPSLIGKYEILTKRIKSINQKI